MISKLNQIIVLDLIAQEVESIIPEVVSVNEIDNIKSISDTSLIGKLNEAIKEQKTNKRIESIIK